MNADPKPIACPVCAGRGWLPPKNPTDFAAPCWTCRGSGVLRTVRLSRLLGCSRHDLWRVRTLRAGALIAARVFFRLFRTFRKELAP